MRELASKRVYAENQTYIVSWRIGDRLVYISIKELDDKGELGILSDQDIERRKGLFGDLWRL